uniref:Uncharacterized protein n=1 Tax=Opuntia streptacantha TaxID=393608 RepID=A0A7C9F1A1_OPUST
MDSKAQAIITLPLFMIRSRCRIFINPHLHKKTVGITVSHWETRSAFLPFWADLSNKSVERLEQMAEALALISLVVIVHFAISTWRKRLSLTLLQAPLLIG